MGTQPALPVGTTPKNMGHIRGIAVDLDQQRPLRVMSDLEQNANERVVAKHEHLFFDGDRASHCYEVLSGFVCVYKLLPDGRRHIVTFSAPGDLIGLGSRSTYAFSAEAIEQTKVRCIPTSELSRMLVTRPEFARQILEFTNNELAEARNQLLTVSRRSAVERIASFLIWLSRKHETGVVESRVVRLPMTRLDIADFLGLTLETVSRTISKLKRMRIIDLPQSSVVVIREREELEALAEL